MVAQNPQAVQGESRKAINNRRVFVSVTGKIIATQRTINNEEFEVVNNIGDVLYLRRGDGVVYKYMSMGFGSDIDSMKMLNTRYGTKQVNILTRRIPITRIVSFDSLFYDIKSTEFITGKMELRGSGYLLSPLTSGAVMQTIFYKGNDKPDGFHIEITLDSVSKKMLEIFIGKGALVVSGELFLFERVEE